MWPRSGIADSTLIQPLAWELPYATGAALKRKKEKKKKKMLYVLGTGPGTRSRLNYTCPMVSKLPESRLERKQVNKSEWKKNKSVPKRVVTQGRGHCSACLEHGSFTELVVLIHFLFFYF